jgi:hypothetical protein
MCGKRGVTLLGSILNFPQPVGEFLFLGQTPRSHY